MMIEFPHLPIHKSTLWIDADKSLSKAHFIEATFRGALGYHLMEFYCPTAIFEYGKFPYSNCNVCRIRRDCLYATMFNPAPGESCKKTNEEIPRPWVISAISENELIRLDVTFFGNNIDKFPLLLEALKELGVRGIGKYNSLFLIKAIEEIHTTYLDECTIDLPKEPKNLILEVITPLALRKDGKRLVQWNTEAFVRSTLRRIYQLSIHQNIPIPENWDYKKMVSIFDGVTSENQERIFSRSRNSTRQKANIDYSGFIGNILLKNVPPEGISILRAASLLSVGTGTVFGGGQVRLRIP